jgi:peptidylprolyl isomerase
VANSRRRERELARRRYERRRLREQETRARRRRRNTIAGAVVATLAVIGGIVALAIGLSGGSDKSTLSAKDQPSATPSASASATDSAAPATPPKKCAPIKPNPPDKSEPTVPPVTGKPSSKLVVKDLKPGHGPGAKSGDKLTVNYVGVSCSTGKAFDASYPRHQTFPVTIGQGQVIQGWDQGLIGMKAGGQRELVIPPALGYGASGSGPIKANETLIFVIDLVKIG